jgi:hypothetical protein
MDIKFFQGFTKAHPLGREIIVNLDHVSMIEVSYLTLGKNADGQPVFSPIDVSQGSQSPDCIRRYTLHVNGEEFVFRSDCKSKALEMIEERYKNSVKG